MKLNNKGMSIVEVVVTFSLIMFLIAGLLIIVMNYRNKASITLERLKLDTFKNNLTQDINNDILTLGLKEAKDDTNTTDTTSPCYGLGLNRCITLTFNNNTKKVFGTSKVRADDRDSVINKYLFYDGLKYKLKDHVPTTLPEHRTYLDLQEIRVFDDRIFDSSFVVLEDGTKAYIYTFNVDVSHIDFKDDFGIHIVASTDNIGM